MKKRDQLEDAEHRHMDNNKMNFKETGGEDVNWINLAEADGEYSQTL
jgi:hypothetical protein